MKKRLVARYPAVVADFDYGEDSPLPVSDWGVPDWRDGSAYPRGDDLTLRQWAWEFLRRDPDYRLDWTEDTGKELSRGVTPDQIPERRRHWRKYGLKRPLDPTKRVADPPFIRRSPRVYNGPADLTLTLGANEMAIIVDLSGSVEDQLKEATAALQSRKADARIHRDKLPTYLRVLDARLAGASISKIASIVWPKFNSETGRQNVRNYFRAAEFLQWRGYYRLAMTPVRRARRGVK